MIPCGRWWGWWWVSCLVLPRLQHLDLLWQPCVLDPCDGSCLWLSFWTSLWQSNHEVLSLEEVCKVSLLKSLGVLWCRMSGFTCTCVHRRLETPSRAAGVLFSLLEVIAKSRRQWTIVLDQLVLYYQSNVYLAKVLMASWLLILPEWVHLLRQLHLVRLNQILA